MAQELQIGYYADLLKQRMEYYLVLWREMRPLPKYPRLEPLSYEKLEQLAGKLRDWYFDGGGMFVSSKARERYFDLMDGLRVLLQKHRSEWGLASALRSPAVVRAYLERSQDWTPPPHLQAIIDAEEDATATGPSPEALEHLRMLGSALRSSVVLPNYRYL